MSKDIRLLILQSGFVFVGEYSRHEHEVRLVQAACVRRWGTTRGLGEIAGSGPTAETALDPCGEVHAPHHAVVFTILCREQAWEGNLPDWS